MWESKPNRKATVDSESYILSVAQKVRIICQSPMSGKLDWATTMQIGPNATRMLEVVLLGEDKAVPFAGTQQFKNFAFQCLF